MGQYFEYETAKELMEKGHTTSVSNGDYDYYVMKDGVVYGQASCDPELYDLEEQEAEDIKQGMWYLIG